MPPDYREEIEESGGDYERVRIVADTISSMTEE
jgi:dGTP triphosphohydrolase